MSQRYTITLSGMPMNIITDESPEAVEAIVGIIDTLEVNREKLDLK